MSQIKPAISNTRLIQRPKLIAQSVFYKLNGQWHKPAMQVFMIIIITHLLEHVFQAYQVYGLGWPRKEALGVLGLAYPWFGPFRMVALRACTLHAVGYSCFAPCYCRTRPHLVGHHICDRVLPPL